MTQIASITASPFEITLDVVFSGAMLNNGELDNPANYTFTEGMYARLAEIIDGYGVRLWVELFANQPSFTMTVADAVKDVGGLPLSPNTFTFSPFESDATMSNYNARVRTWRESNFVQEDSQRIYLAGTKGIDVFRKQSAVIPARWAQVFDEYGVNAMFVANFPSDLIITDTVPPFLQNQNPSPGSTANPDTSIYFEVADATTAVEITSVTAYVNGLTVFSGGLGGWASGYSGKVEVGYKQLNFTLYPDSDFVVGSTVLVRVVASDLLGNLLDISYSFDIFTLVLGFGLGSFGSMPFGSI